MSNATVTGDTIRNASAPMPSKSPGSYRFSMCSWSPCNERSLRNIPRSASDFPPGKTHYYSRWARVNGRQSLLPIDSHPSPVGYRPSRIKPRSNPRLRDEQCFEQVHRVAIGHAGDEIPRGGVEPFVIDRARVKKFFRSFADLFPESAQHSGRLLEFRRGELVFVHGREQKFPQIERGFQYVLAH